ncbi:MAG: N-acetylneuraminate synthase family protein [Bacilli bacterium]
MMFIRVKDTKSEAYIEFENFLKANNFKYSKASYDQFIVDSLYYKNIYKEFPKYEYAELSSYKLISRVNHPLDLVINVRSTKIGGNSPLFIAASPCVSDDNEILTTIALSSKRSGARGLHGGTYKSKNSNLITHGISRDNLKLFNQCSSKNSLLSIVEISSVNEVDFFKDNVDIIQVGTRNMQNFELLKALGKIKNPILLKRGFGNTIDELLKSADYIVANGNPNVILCECGIRTFEEMTNETLDLSAVVLLKRLTNLPVFVDPTDSLGDKELIKDTLASIVVTGCDGIILNVNNYSLNVLPEEHVSLNLKEFQEAITNLKLLSYYIKREI